MSVKQMNVRNMNGVGKGDGARDGIEYGKWDANHGLINWSRKKKVVDNEARQSRVTS